MFRNAQTRPEKAIADPAGLGKSRYACALRNPSEGIFLALRNVGNREVNDLDIEPDTPVFNVPRVVFQAFAHQARVGAGFAPEAVYLRVARDAWRYKVPNQVFLNHLRIFLGVLKHVRPWPHHRHIAAQHIEELGQLVEACLAQERPDLGNAFVAARGLFGVRFVVDIHRAKLVAVKKLVFASRTGLLEKNRPPRGELDGQPDNEEQPRENEQDHRQRKHQIEGTFQYPVAPNLHRLLPESHDGHVVVEVNVDFALHQAPEIGCDFEEYEILVRKIGQFLDHLRIPQRLGVVYLIDFVLHAIIPEMLHLAFEHQAGQFRLIVKEAHELVALALVGEQVMVQVVARVPGPHNDHAAFVGPQFNAISEHQRRGHPECQCQGKPETVRHQQERARQVVVLVAETDDEHENEQQMQREGIEQVGEQAAERKQAAVYVHVAQQQHPQPRRYPYQLENAQEINVVAEIDNGRVVPPAESRAAGEFQQKKVNDQQDDTHQLGIL